MAADKFFDLCKCQIDNLDVNFMLELFVKRLQDAESEVRNIASSHVADFCEFLTREQIILRILPIIQGIASDKSQFTRGSLASNVMVICRYISKEDVQSYLVPLFLKLLKDEFHEVRLNIISKLEAVAHSIGLDQLSATLMPAILDLASDRKWRVRIAILQHIPLIAKELGVQFFDQNLSNICMNWLVDEVFSIREAAVKNLSNIVQIFGVNWAISSIIPKVKEMTSNSNYLHRITCLYAASEFAQTMKSRELIEEMLPMILLMSSDPVPNIRFNVCKTLESILKEKLLSADMLSSKIEPILSSLSHEDDPDVQYYAQRALKYTR
jgi:serine/threonine-protein phosphatase 2A regulatory subunit A